MTKRVVKRRREELLTRISLEVTNSSKPGIRGNTASCSLRTSFLTIRVHAFSTGIETARLLWLVISNSNFINSDKLVSGGIKLAFSSTNPPRLAIICFGPHTVVSYYASSAPTRNFGNDLTSENLFRKRYRSSSILFGSTCTQLKIFLNNSTVWAWYIGQTIFWKSSSSRSILVNRV